MSPRLRHRRAHSQGGFTLLELVVATGIFALLSLMAFGGLHTVLDTESATRDTGSRLAELQSALWFMGRDVGQMAPRPVRDALGGVRAAMVGDGSAGVLELTRGGWDNPLGRPRSELRRVGYRLADGHLERLTWWALDRVQGTEPAREAVLSGVTDLTLRFLDGDREWTPVWPPPGTAADGLPRAVEVVLDLEDWGRVRRVFRVLG